MGKTFSKEKLNLFKYPACIIIAGYTNSGKTHLCNMIQEKYQHVFNKTVVCGVTSHLLQQNPIVQHILETHGNIIDSMTEHNSYSDPRAHVLLKVSSMFHVYIN